MKRILLAFALFFAFAGPASAAHIKGGFFTYQYLGPGSTPGTLNYRVTLTVYMLCSAESNPNQLDNPINFSIFDGASNVFLQNVSVNLTNQYRLSKFYNEPCITGDETGCYYYIVVYDLPSIELPSSPNGYIFSYQRCCRINGIINLNNSGTVGNTFSIKIPGTAVAPGAETNSSPVFQINDTAVVCRGSYFQYSFQATDPNSTDSLSYSFCNAFLGASQNIPAPTTATNPPYTSVPYALGFSGSQPMGPGVTINPVTGVISGVAPTTTGQYVICVCVNEYNEDGVLIGTTRKELHIDVKDCNPLEADLLPDFTTCDGFTFNFQNRATNSDPGIQYMWTFGEPISGTADTSYLETPSHTYLDTGIYIVKLRVTLAGGLCADSATMRLGVYPGFFPGFVYTGSCYTNPYQFTDTTKTTYGAVNSWSWNFGDLATLADTSHNQNPNWTYPNPGPRTVQLIVTNSKGCKDTATVNVNVLDKPPLSVAFADTLICRNDAVQLSATGTGAFTWTPNVSITGANTATPTVTPLNSTWYYVNLDENGCLNRDSVHVRVVANVSLTAMADTTICQGDQVQLSAVSDGLSFAWTPAADLNDATIINPVATTNTTTTYTITATIGSCTATDEVVVTTVPYPVANAGADQTICYNASAQLNGSHDGNSFTWEPASYLNNPNILNPVSSPPRTTTYVLSAYDTDGCPKPGRDTVVITMMPRVRANAGRDTVVVVGQPLQFNGSGGVSYTWSPATGLSSTTIPNPIGVYTANDDSIRYKLIVADEIGCEDSAFVTVRVFKTNPTIFVPTAFTPNNDGKNDVIRPICVGIQKLNYFSIYNRWGQLVFTTTTDRHGWDGRINGQEQSSGVFVWMVSATDYLGKTIFLKGTVALIR